MTEEFNQEMKNPVMEFQDEAFKQDTKIQEGDLTGRIYQFGMVLTLFTMLQMLTCYRQAHNKSQGQLQARSQTQDYQMRNFMKFNWSSEKPHIERIYFELW